MILLVKGEPLGGKGLIHVPLEHLCACSAGGLSKAGIKIFLIHLPDDVFIFNGIRTFCNTCKWGSYNTYIRLSNCCINTVTVSNQIYWQLLHTVTWWKHKEFDKDLFAMEFKYERNANSRTNFFLKKKIVFFPLLPYLNTFP